MNKVPAERNDEDPELQDLAMRYVLRELTTEDEARVDGLRAKNAALDQEIEALSQALGSVRACQPAELRRASDLPWEEIWAVVPMQGGTQTLDDGHVVDPDQPLRPGLEGARAAHIVAELEALGWRRVRGRDEDGVRRFYYPGTDRELVFPFGDDAWLGQTGVARFRQLMRPEGLG